MLIILEQIAIVMRRTVQIFLRWCGDALGPEYVTDPTRNVPTRSLVLKAEIFGLKSIQANMFDLSGTYDCPFPSPRIFRDHIFHWQVRDLRAHGSTAWAHRNCFSDHENNLRKIHHSLVFDDDIYYLRCQAGFPRRSDIRCAIRVSYFIRETLCWMFSI